MKHLKLFELKTPEYGCDSTRLTAELPAVELLYFFQLGKSRMVGSIKFENVIRYEFTNEIHARVMPNESHEAVAERLESEKVKEITAEVRALSNQWPFAVRHFLVDLRNDGSYEIIAESVHFTEPTEARSDFKEDLG